MSSIRSPWLEQLRRTRPAAVLDPEFRADCAIIGGGIAGVTSAFFILTHTDKSVALIEGNKVAHGATGHNAGQIVSYFERPFADIVGEFGLMLAAAAQQAINSAWLLLEEIGQEIGLHTPIQQFTGYAGIPNRGVLLHHLENLYLLNQAGITHEKIYIASELLPELSLPSRYRGHYEVAGHAQILELLETKNTSFIGAIAERKGVTNSALLCEEIIGYLLAHYPQRFRLAEHTPVRQIVLEPGAARLRSGTIDMQVKEVVLCTNGFEQLHIVESAGDAIDVRFHHLVRGTVGYMAAYLEPLGRPAKAISFLPEKELSGMAALEPYFYLTRRPFEGARGEAQNLISVGGPETLMDDTNEYRVDQEYPERAQEEINRFLHATYAFAPDRVDYLYRWHGLMGYTPNGIRVIGREPRHSSLLYNIGCNGIGILPSIYGSRRIARLVAGETVEQSIFDPRDMDARARI